MTQQLVPRQGSSLLLRIVALVVVVLLVVVGAIGIVLARTSEPPPPPLAAPVEPMYPDLGMAPLEDILVGHEEGGADYLRFSASIVNVGEADLLVAANRPMPLGGGWRVWQRVVDATGGYSQRLTDATLEFAGDAHDHWHVAKAEAHQLETMDGEVVASLVKTGFCFFDNLDYAIALPTAPPEPAHHAVACGEQFHRDIAMGLSVGWGDEYPWYLLGQTINITNVPDGRYRLRAIADPADWFVETDETNNDTWTVVDLGTVDTGRSITVVEQGPSAPTTGSTQG